MPHSDAIAGARSSPAAAARAQQFEARLLWARAQDQADPLAPLRRRFALPRSPEGRALLYFCGHSLGPAPIAARALIEAEIEDWERHAALGHEQARSPWIGYAEQLQPDLARLIGATPLEVVAMNSLSVNLHLLLASFYRPQPRRSAILIEAGAFPSDRHVVTAQIGWHGLDSARELIELAPRAGEELLRPEDIEQCIASNASRLALVLWPGVQYRTGQYFDLPRIVRAAHAAGACIGLDLAHAIGNVPLALHDDDADFAAWCSYKYLNAGPGALAGAFVHTRHLQRRDLPRLAGWWGQDPATRFQMPAQFTPAAGAAGWAVSNPPIFSSAPLRASLPMFTEAGMPALRAKSMALNALFESLLLEFAPEELTLVTPTDPAQRGCQLSLRVRGSAARGRAVFQALARRAVVCDWREPDVMRFGLAPLYIGFEDVLRAAWQLCDALEESR
ncbi:MAG: kynureninase [Steroidobacteraceae bacterium]|jgi:kynureninase